MFESIYLHAVIVVLLILLCYLLNFWSKEHAVLMSIISKSIADINKKIK
jgi:hypothetical protein